MNVVSHQHIRVDGASAMRGCIQQVVSVGGIVLVGSKAHLPIVAALDDVLRNAGNVESG